MSKLPIVKRATHIYGRKFGLALTFESFQFDTLKNKRAIILILSEGWYSSHSMIEPLIDTIVKPLLNKGFSVFAVTHSSNPMFTMADAIEDAHLAVKYIKHESDKLGIDPTRLGVIGWSAGGQLALSLSCQPKSAGKSHSPVEQRSSHISACAVYFPIVDFLNWDGEGQEMLGNHPAIPLYGSFAFKELDESRKKFEAIDATSIREMVRKLSPIEWPSKNQAPTIIITGDKDNVVPTNQSVRLASKMKNVGGQYKFVEILGGTHDMSTVASNLEIASDWFDKHL